MEKQTIGNSVRTISLHHLIWDFFKQITLKWRFVLVVTLIGTLAGTGYAVIKNIKEEKMQTGASENIIVSEEEFMHISDVAKVYDLLTEQQEYNDQSIWMKCGNLTVGEASVLYQVNTRDEKSDAQIVEMYLNQLEGHELYEKIAGDLQQEIGEKYLKEITEYAYLENGLFRIKVKSYSKENADMILKSIEEYMELYGKQLKEKLDIEYDIKKLTSENIESIDTSLKEKKLAAETELAALQNEYESAIADLNLNEQNYFQAYLIARKNETYVDGQDLIIRENQTTVLAQEGIAKKRIIIDTILGFMLGICCSFGYFIISYCYSAVLVNGEEIEGMYGVSLLGYIEKGKKKIEKWFLKKQKKNYVLKDMKSECKEIITRLKMQLTEGESIYVTGTGKKFEKYQKILIQEAEKQGVLMIQGENIIGMEFDLQQIKSTDQILILEEEGTSKYADISKEIQLCKEARKRICGVVVII